jgi:hypothetical protein
LKRDFDSGREITVFVFNPRDAQDVVDYWNLRIFKPWVFPIHVDWFFECAEWTKGFITNNYKPLQGNPNGVMTSTTLEFGRSISADHRAELVASISKGTPAQSFLVQPSYDNIWEQWDYTDGYRPIRPVRISGGTAHFDQEIEENESLRGNDLTVRIPKVVPAFLGSAQRYEDSSWTNVVGMHNYGLSNGNVATVYPINLFDPKIPNLRWGEWSPISREGWVLPQHMETSYEVLHLERGRDAIINWFGQRDIVAIPSDAGRVAEQIIAAVDGLHSCAMFADPDILKLLNEMATSGEDSGVPVQRWENILRSKDFKKMPWITLQRFLDASILRAGLEIKCPNCAKLNWYGVSLLDYDIICHRCLKEFKLPQTAAKLNGLRWLYRTIGPFAVPGFASGGYCVALALRLFAHVLNGENLLTWTTGLELSFEKSQSEVDFAFWYKRSRLFGTEEPVLMIGEAKSFSNEAITKTDIDRIRTLAEKMPGAFLVFAVLKEALSVREIARLRSLAKWGRRRPLNGRPRNPVIVQGLSYLRPSGSRKCGR